MKPFGLIVLMMAIGPLSSVSLAQENALTPVSLRCEYRADPLGIDIPHPRLSWLLSAPKPAMHQRAYEILAADSLTALEADNGNLWHTGKVDSAESIQIPYAGKPLMSRQQCYWKVRVWDQSGQASGWSKPGTWSMGLLRSNDWNAKWIGYDAPAITDLEAPTVTSTELMSGASWVWTATSDKTCQFRATIDVPSGDINSAKFYFAAGYKCLVWVNGRPAVRVNFTGLDVLRETALVDLKAGAPNLIAVEAAHSGDTPNPAGFIGKLVVRFKSGETFEAGTRETWKSHVGGGIKDAHTPNFDDSAWQPAAVLGAFGDAPWGVLHVTPELQLPPPPYLRKEFAARPEVTRATAYATAFGIYELQINGQRVGDLHFTPGWTDYGARVYYNTFDVTSMIRASGQNAIGAILADGWYAGYIGFRLFTNQLYPRDFYGDKPRLRVQLEIEYADGTTDTFVTDETWKAAYGPILQADIQMGETHDRRINFDGWSTAGFDDTAWATPAVSGDVEVPVQAYPGAPVRQFEVVPAINVSEVAPKTYIYDLGQNIAGWARIRVNGKPGQKVVVRHAERLEGGKLYTINLRKARATDTYILRGGTETLEPKFTFHGFQYIEIDGLDTPPAPADVMGIVVNADIPQTGAFECSNPLLNRLFLNIVWGQKGNYLEAPTDCPQRDERLGWTGDAQFFMPTAAYCADVSAFFTKWLVDLAVDAQLPDGSWADVAPNVELGGGNVAWGDAAIICTYQMYRYYGDTRLVERLYPNLIKGMDFLENTSKDFVRSKIGYGDWLNLGGGAKDEVICTAYFAYLAKLMAEMAEAIGDKEHARKYTERASNIRDAFVKNFVSDDGRILESSQTGYALAFSMDLLPDDRKAEAADHFVAEIARFNNHLATGFIGTPRLLPALSKAGRRDVAYKLLMTTGYPSWLFQVTLGATTMWERWDGWTPDKGFQDPGMNSFNHYGFGSVGEYLFAEVGGIRATAPGFQSMVIAPKPGGGLTYANTSYDSIRGKIVSNWTHNGNTFTLDVTIPPNVRAEVHVPAKSKDAVQGANPEFTRFNRFEDNAVVYDAEPGQWYFTSEL